MRKLLIYLKDYKKESVLAPLFKMLEAIFELFVPLVMSAVIDVGIKNSDKPYIIKMCLVLVALGLYRPCLLHNSTVFCRKGCLRFCNKAQTFAFRSYPVAFLLRNGHNRNINTYHTNDQ